MKKAKCQARSKLMFSFAHITREARNERLWNTREDCQIPIKSLWVWRIKFHGFLSEIVMEDSTLNLSFPSFERLSPFINMPSINYTSFRLYSFQVAQISQKKNIHCPRRANICKFIHSLLYNNKSWTIFTNFVKKLVSHARKVNKTEK